MTKSTVAILAAAFAAGALVAVNTAFAALVAVAALGCAGMWWLTRGQSTDRLGDVMVVAAFVSPMDGIRLPANLDLVDPLLLVATALAAQRHLVGQVPVDRETLSGTRYVLWIALGGLIGTIWAQSAAASIADIVRFVIAVGGMFLVFALWRPTRPQLVRVAKGFVLGASVNAIAGFVVTSTVTPRGYGLSFHPNAYGISCLLALAVLSGIRFEHRWLSAVAALSLFAGVVNSGSRAAFLGFGVLVVSVAFLRRPSMRGRPVPRARVFVAILAGVLVLLLRGQALLDRLFGGRAGRSDQGRAELLDLTVESIKAHPFTGTGFELARAAHNLYLQIWVAAGLIGLIAWAVMIAWILRLVFRNLQDPLVAATGAAFVTYLAVGLVQNGLWNRWTWMPVAVAAATSAYHEHRRAELEPEPPAQPPPRPVRPRSRALR